MTGPILGDGERTVRAHPGVWGLAVAFAAFVAVVTVVVGSDRDVLERIALAAMAIAPFVYLGRVRLVVRGDDVEVVRVFRRETVRVDDIVRLDRVVRQGSAPYTVLHLRGESADRWHRDPRTGERTVDLSPGLTRGHVARALGLPEPPKEPVSRATILVLVFTLVVVAALFALT